MIVRRTDSIRIALPLPVVIALVTMADDSSRSTTTTAIVTTIGVDVGLAVRLFAE